MSPWLAIFLVTIVLAAAAGVVPLRRAADQQWADHVRRTRIAATPEYKRIAKGFVELQLVIHDSFTPALMRAAAAAADLAKALDALRPPWWKRVLYRIRGWVT